MLLKESSADQEVHYLFDCISCNYYNYISYQGNADESDSSESSETVSSIRLCDMTFSNISIHCLEL